MATQELVKSPITMSFSLTTMDQIRAYCAVIAGTEMVPKAYRQKPDDIFVTINHGMEIGLRPLQALQCIATINGIPSIYGDAALSLVRSSQKLEDFDEWFEVDGVRIPGNSFPIQGLVDDGKDVVAFCLSKRIGMKRERITTYSIRDAIRARLWGKEGPWTNTPQRMLMFRARSWNLRDNFGDVLKGLAIYEEAQDIDTEKGPDGSYRAEAEANKAKLDEGRALLAQQTGTVIDVPAKQEPEPTEAKREEKKEPPAEDEKKEPPQEQTPPSGMSAKYDELAKRVRGVISTAEMGKVMYDALNGPDSLVSPEERRSLEMLKDQRLEQLRAAKKK